MVLVVLGLVTALSLVESVRRRQRSPERQAEARSFTVEHIPTDVVRRIVRGEMEHPDDRALVLGGRWCAWCDFAVDVLHEEGIPTLEVLLEPDQVGELYPELVRLCPDLPEDRVVVPIILYGTEGSGLLGGNGITIWGETRTRNGLLPFTRFRQTGADGRAQPEERGP